MIKRVLFYLLISTIVFGQVKQVKLGIDVLKNNSFAELENKTIGLITNPTGVDADLNSTIDILYNAENVNLEKLFGPEHGIRGDFEAGNKVTNYIDSETGIPVYSLYGKFNKPTQEMLKGLDALVFDIQDIGARSYTYISTMGLAMEACAESNIEFIILDRPNPLGGKRIEGNLIEDGYYSFVSQFNIPYIHGMTVGELAKFINNELSQNKCHLKVIKMEGWKREMLFSDTGLQWVPSSPHIPEFDSPFYYSATGIIGELQQISNGVGYTLPFKLLASDNFDSELIASNMNNLSLEGVKFRPIVYKPYYSFGKDKYMHGVEVHITNFKKCELLPIQFYFLEVLHKLNPNFRPFEDANKNRIRMFDLVIGTDDIRKEFIKEYKTDDILILLRKDVEKFRKLSSKYYLYN